MTQRSIPAGETPTVIIRAGGNVVVEGWESDRVLADTEARWGLKVGRRTEGEIGRVRAKVDERVLLDVGIPSPRGKKKDDDIPADAIEVSLGGSGRVQVPVGSTVKVYAGRTAEAHGVRGGVTLYAGRDALARNVGTLHHASAGRKLDFDCETVAGSEAKFSAGGDLRCRIRRLADVRLIINDVGGRWEALFGTGQATIRLNSGGEVTLVTDQEVTGAPPDYIVGNVEKPNDSQKENAAPQ